MCANYAPTRAQRLAALMGAAPPREDYVAQAFPGHVAPILVADAHHTGAAGRRAELAVFGMIPPWSRDGANYRHTYNARTETVAEKPSFRHAWRARQWCVVPADAFYEPCYESGKAIRWRIESATDDPLAIAGIWERWRGPQGEWVSSFSMLTINADAHPVMARFHAPGDEKRSVVLLPADRIDAWLSASIEGASSMLEGFDPSRVRVAADPLPPRRPRPSAGAGQGGALFEHD